MNGVDEGVGEETDNSETSIEREVRSVTTISISTKLINVVRLAAVANPIFFPLKR